MRYALSELPAAVGALCRGAFVLCANDRLPDNAGAIKTNENDDD